jgi:hypothetical protein
LDNDNNDGDAKMIVMVKETRIGAWNYPQNYAKKVESLDLLDVFAKSDENEWEK